MSINLKITLGTVNYTDWLHVTASKVSTPSSIAAEVWIDVPVTNENFILPGLDPENYYIRYYDAPTNSSLGSLVAELIVNALSPEWAYERRFYTVNGSGTYDPTAGTSSITDPYLIGKTITGSYKEGFRPLEPDVETSFDDSIGKFNVINGTSFDDAEKFCIELKYASGFSSSSSTSGGLYSGFLNVTEASKTLLAADRNKCIRLVGTAATQVITVPALAAIAIDDGLFFDNSCGGTAVQPKILFPGTDKLRFNGFMIASNLFNEFWIGTGEHLYMKKTEDGFWELRMDYKGVDVGEIIMPGIKSHPMIKTENGQLIDGDEYPRMWWWLKNVLTSESKYVTDTVTGSFVPTAARMGQFALHSTLKKFRMPSTGGLVPKGLKNYESYGSDIANRPIDAPGGVQLKMLLAHGHKVNTGGTTGGADPGRSLIRQSYNGDGYASGTGVSSNGPFIEIVGGNDNRVDNNGVIFARRM